MTDTNQDSMPVWVMPEWMKPYEEAGCFQNTGGWTITDLMNTTHQQRLVNVVLASMVISVASQITMLCRLRHQGFLQGSMQDLQLSISAWAEDTFPEQTDQSVGSHLLEEAVELHRDTERSAQRPVLVDDLMDNVADVIILALCLAGRLRQSAHLATVRKMQDNRSRTWAYDPARGYHHHVS